MNTLISTTFILILAVMFAINVSISLLGFVLGSILFFVVGINLWNRRVKNEKVIHNFSIVNHGYIKDNKWKYGSIVLLAMMFYWYAYYPGGFNLDALGQWYQIHNIIPYNDWHPIMSTLLYKLNCVLVDDFSFSILVQIVAFSASVAYLMQTLHENGIDDRILMVLALFIAIFPSIGLNVTSLLKDVQYTILIIILLNCTIRIISSQGQWLDNRLHILFLGIIIGLSVLVRHNGLLFSVPMMILLIFFYKHKINKICVATAISLLIVAFVKYPLSQILNVEPHDNVVGELVGIPMAVLGNVLVKDSDSLPEDIHDFLNEVAPDAEWKEHYIIGEWDSCKWEFGGTALLKGESISRIILYALRAAAADPKDAYESIRENTRIVWSICKTAIYWVPDEYIAPNEFGIISKEVPLFHEICEIGIRISMLWPLNMIVWNTGFQIFAVLLCFFMYFDSNHIEAVLLIIPLLCYDFGTMLLLSGPNQRYFFCNAVIWAPLVLAIAVIGSKGSKSNKT